MLDLYLADGLCFFFRLGLALLREAKWRLKIMDLNQAADWWAQLQVRYPRFKLNFEI